MEPWIAYLLAYLYGSIPFSYIVAYIWKRVDITHEGTRNVGASNVGLVTGSTAAFLIALVLDMSKGVIPTLLWGPIAGAFGVVGHIFSVYLILTKFRCKRIRSGLGMAATIGWIFLNAWQVGLIALLLFAFFYIIMNPMDWRRHGILTWYAIEEGNIETIFAFGAAGIIYTTFFNPPPDVRVAIAIITVAVFYAYARAIREQIIEFWDWKKSEEYLKHLKDVQTMKNQQ